jgi:hypothetical protein
MKGLSKVEIFLTLDTPLMNSWSIGQDLVLRHAFHYSTKSSGTKCQTITIPDKHSGGITAYPLKKNNGWCAKSLDPFKSLKNVEI